MDKTCTNCRTTKPRAEFTKDKHAADGLNHRCGECTRQRSREAHARNRDARLAKNQAWRDANKPRIRQRKRTEREKRKAWVVYRLTFPDGCFYVGSTCDLEYRASVHRCLIGKGTHRNTRLNAYQEQSFEVSVVDRCNSERSARWWEALRIREAVASSGVGCLNGMLPTDDLQPLPVLALLGVA